VALRGATPPSSANTVAKGGRGGGAPNNSRRRDGHGGSGHGPKGGRAREWCRYGYWLCWS
jgi:hypothetical protein